MQDLCRLVDAQVTVLTSKEELSWYIGCCELCFWPEPSCRSSSPAPWFWRKFKPWLNPAADRGWFRVTTRLVNGGFNGWNDRLQFYQRNRTLLGLGSYAMPDEDRSIRQFQAEHGLLVDGDAGKNTLGALLKG